MPIQQNFKCPEIQKKINKFKKKYLKNGVGKDLTVAFAVHVG